MNGRQNGGRPTGPRFEAIVVLVIASCALLATSSGLPSISATYEGETAFDGPGDQVVPIVVRLNEAAWQSAVRAQPLDSAAPAVDLEIYHSSSRAVRLTGTETLSLADCGQSGDCDLPAQLTVRWRGDGPATVIWTVQSRVFFTGDSIPDGASVGVTGKSPDRLPTLVLLGAVLGVLGAILAWGVRRRLRPRREAVQVMDTGVLIAVAAVLALAGASLIAGPAEIVQGLAAAVGGLLLIGLAALVVIGAWRRARDGGLLALAVLGVATLLAVPSLLYLLLSLPVYQPAVVVVSAAVLTGASGLGLGVALANERSSSTGEPLTGTQRMVVILQAVLTGACLIVGVAVLAADLSIRRTLLGELIALTAAGLSLLALQRWLRGRTRLLTASWILVSLVALLGLGGVIMLRLALLPEWQQPLPAAVSAVLSPPAIGALAVFGAGVLVVRARRRAPVASEAGS